MSALNLIINMSDSTERKRLGDHLRPLQGKQRFEVTPFRARRSDRQNRYYWPCFVAPFAEFLRDQDVKYDGHVITNDDAHEILKYMHLPPAEIINPKTGEVVSMPGKSTGELSTGQFNEYLDRVAAFLAGHCGFVVADPNEYREREELGAA